MNAGDAPEGAIVKYTGDSFESGTIGFVVVAPKPVAGESGMAPASTGVLDAPVAIEESNEISCPFT